MKKDIPFFLFRSVAAGLFILLFLIPVVLVLSNARLNEIFTVIHTPYFRQLTGFTFLQAALSTVAALTIGFPAAYILTKYRFKGEKILQAVYGVAFVMPPVLVVLGFVIFYGNSGYLNRILMKLFNLDSSPVTILYSFPAVILAHSFYNFPVVAHTVSSYWATLSQDDEDCARTDGAGEFRVFTMITLPKLLPAVASACTLVFLYCFTSFAIILVLGGGPSLSTLEVEIYRQARISMNTALACSLSLISLFCSALILILQQKAEKLCTDNSTSGIDSAYPGNAGRGKRPSAAVRIYLVLSSLFILLPIISIAIRAFFPNSAGNGATLFSLKQFGLLLQNPQPILNSLSAALVSTLLGTSTALAFCSFIVSTKNKAAARLADYAAMLPMAVSSVILGLAYFIVSSHLKTLPTLISVSLVHSVIILPFAVRTLLPAYRSIPRVLTEDTQMQGAGNMTVLLRIHVPLLTRPLLTALAFGFAISMGELNSTLIMSLNRFSTIPVQIYRLVDSYNFSGACASGCILMLLCSLCFSFR